MPMNTDTLRLPVFRAIVSTVIPEARGLDESGWSRVEALVDAALHDRPAALRRRVRLFLQLIEWLPVLRYGRRFTSLAPAQRVRFLSFLQDHPVQRVRVGFWGVRTLALLGYYAQPEAASRIGYAPDPRGWEARR